MPRVRCAEGVDGRTPGQSVWRRAAGDGPVQLEYPTSSGGHIGTSPARRQFHAYVRR